MKWWPDFKLPPINLWSLPYQSINYKFKSSKKVESVKLQYTDKWYISRKKDG